VGGDRFSICRVTGLGVPTRRYDSIGTTHNNRIVALLRIGNPTYGHRTNVLIVVWSVQQLRQHGRITHVVGMTLKAQISSISSSIPMCILNHMYRLGPPFTQLNILQYLRAVLAAFHSYSPSDLTPLLSIPLSWFA